MIFMSLPSCVYLDSIINSFCIILSTIFNVFLGNFKSFLIFILDLGMPFTSNDAHYLWESDDNIWIEWQWEKHKFMTRFDVLIRIYLFEFVPILPHRQKSKFRLGFSKLQVMATTNDAAHYCKDGIVIPALQTSPRNSILYLAGLFYCFLGIQFSSLTSTNK